jgi:dynein heavy chain
MTAVMNKLGLQPVMNFKRKVLQLYEMVNCRHGLMIVGATLSGKSTAYRVLA